MSVMMQPNQQAQSEAAETMVPAGYKQTEVGVIPSHWIVKSIKDLKLDISDGNYSSKYPRSDEFKVFGVPFIRANNIKGLTVTDSDMMFISEEKHSEITKGHLKKKDILVTNRGEIGNIAVVPDRHIGSNINAQIVRINTGGTVLEASYFAYYLQRSDINKKLVGLQTGSALKQLPINRLVTLPVVIPSKKEQIAIANALSDVDALIGSLKALNAKKQAIKTATMQQLLTGRTRLPQFAKRADGSPKGYKTSELGEIPEDWYTPSIAELTRNIIDYRGRTPKKLGMDWGGGNIVALSAGNVKKGYIDFDAECYLGSESLYRRWMTSGDPEKGDIAFTMEAPLGNVALIPDHQKYIMSQRTILLQVDRDGFNPCFIFQLLMSDTFSALISDRATGSTAQGIKRTTFEKIQLIIPISIDEQTAIATILSDMDEEIKVLEQRLAKTRDLKQGMMQQLLTGKIRLIQPLAGDGSHVG